MLSVAIRFCNSADHSPQQQFQKKSHDLILLGSKPFVGTIYRVWNLKLMWGFRSTEGLATQAPANKRTRTSHRHCPSCSSFSWYGKYVIFGSPLGVKPYLKIEIPRQCWIQEAISILEFKNHMLCQEYISSPTNTCTSNELLSLWQILQQRLQTWFSHM